MCNCNSSFCAVCCRRVKAYRFDNVPEITGDLQLYTEFYKVGEAYGHWKFTVDDLEAYLDIPTVLWNDKLVAFGHTATGGLFYQSDFIFDYTTSSLTLGDRGVAAEGLYSLTIGNANTAEGLYSLIVGESNVTNTTHSAVFGKANSILGSYNSIFGQGNNINGSGNNVFGAGNIVGDNSNIFGASLDTNGFYGNAMFSDATGGSSAIANNAFTAQFAGGYRFRLDASSTAVNISSTGIVTIDNVVNNNAEDQLLVWNVTTKEVEYREVSSLPGGGGGSGTVTAVNSGAGMDFTNFTTSGTIILGAGSDITLASTNSVSGTTHAHKLNLGGTSGQYLAGDNTLQTFPTIPTYTAGTGISIASNIITNTLPSKWTDTGSYIVPTVNRPIRTNNGASEGFANLYTGDTSFAGYLGIFETSGNRIGYIGYQTSFMNYTVQIGNHRFYGGSVYVDIIPSAPSATNLLVSDSGTVSTRTVASLPFTNNTGTVTAVNSGAGMDFTNFTTSGTIILGTPSTITLSSTNAATGTTHSHEFDLGGLSTEYLAGDNTLQAFPTIPTVTPSALTRTNDTNILLNLTGTPSTSLLQAVDIEVAWSGLLSYTRGGTGLGSLGTANQILRVNAGATALEYFTPSWTSNTGTVTNFSANDLTTGYTYPLFTVNVTNPTTTPDLTFSLPSLPQKFVFAAPWGVTGTPLWRQLLPSDLQADGATTGQVITWNGTAWVPSAASGGVTSVSAGNGMNFTTITTTGTVTMGTPSSITLASTNSASGTTHSHALALGGTSAQYLRGDNTLATFPTIPTQYWTLVSGMLEPISIGNNIGTSTNGGTWGFVQLKQWGAGQVGSIEFRLSSGVRLGYIGYYTSNMSYWADSGYHKFYNRPVQIDSIATDNALTNFLVVNGSTNEVKLRTLASLTGLTTDVFKIQGGTTNASAITDDIYHNGKLKLGTSTSSAYQLSVSGTGYFTSTVDFNNNVGIQGFTTGAVIKNLVKLNSSNQEEIGVSGTDIILPAYTSARSADTKVSTDKYMYVNASGLVKLDSDQNIRNVIGWISKTTNTGVTAGGGPTKISGSTVQQTAVGPYTTVSGNLTIPAQDRYHLITVTVQFVTTSGVAATPNITFDVYNGSGVVQDSAYIVNHDVINDTKEYSFVLQGTTAGVTSIYVRATATVAGITVQKCHMKAMDMGPV